MHRLALIFTLTLLLAAPVTAQSTAQTSPQPTGPPIRVYLPHGGYFRPGQYTPVYIETTLPSDPADLLEIRGDGVLTTAVSLTKKSFVAVPLLVLDRPSNVRWALPGVGEGTLDGPFTRLEEDQVLIALPGGETAVPPAVTELFPAKRPVVVALPVDTDVLKAWEVLDAVVIDSTSTYDLWRVLSAGTVIVVRTETRPDDQWPWQRVAGGWLLAPRLAGPRSAIFPRAYDVAHALRPGQPATQRRRIVFIGAVVAILALGVSLWRSRYAAAGVVGLSAVAAAVIAVWGGPATDQPRRAVGAIVVHQEAAGLVQFDEWTVVKSFSSSQVAAQNAVQSLTRPVLSSPRHAELAKLRLYCGPRGPVQFGWRAEPGAPMIFLTRTVTASAREHDGPANETSPLRDLARQAYLSPAGRIEGEVWYQFNYPPGEWDEEWPSVVVRQPVNAE